MLATTKQNSIKTGQFQHLHCSSLFTTLHIENLLQYWSIPSNYSNRGRITSFMHIYCMGEKFNIYTCYYYLRYLPLASPVVQYKK